MPLTTAPLVNVSRSPSTRRRGGSNPAPIVPGVDSTPNAFTFTDVTNAAVSTLYESNTITVAGIDTGSSLSIVGGEYSLNGGAYATAPTTVQAGDTVKVRATSSGSGSTAVNVTLTIGGVSDTYTVTTGVASDTTPDAFTFTDVTGATISTVYVSNTITVGGINAPASLTISGGEYSINGGAYASSNTTVSNGDTVKVRGTSSGSNSTTVNVSLTIGGVSDVYSITTAAVVSPFSFTPFAYYDESSVIQSASAISQWTDKGPNGIHLVQGIGASQPAWNAGASRIEFDGTDDYLIAAARDLSAKTTVCAFARLALVGAPSTTGDGIVGLAPVGGDDWQGSGALLFMCGAANVLSTLRAGGGSNQLDVPLTAGVASRVGSIVSRSGGDTIYNRDTSTTVALALSTAAFSNTGQFILGARWLSGIYPGYRGHFTINRLVLLDFVPTTPQLNEIWTWLAPPAAFSFTPLAYYDETSVVQAAGAVSQWTDKGPNGIHLTQATGAAQPTWDSASQRVVFDGINDFMRSTSQNLSAKPALAAFAYVELSSGSLSDEGYIVIARAGYNGLADLSPHGRLLVWTNTSGIFCAYGSGPLAITAANDAMLRIGTVLNESGIDTLYNKSTESQSTGEISSAGYSSTSLVILGSRWDNDAAYSFAAMKIKRLVLLDFVPTLAQRDEIWAWLTA